jgi:hypothetical protein
MRTVSGLGAVVLLLLVGSVASAQKAEPATEPKDPTRLDVERLPPEAITLDRSMFARGFYLEARMGGRGFVGGLAPLVAPGLATRVTGGYELLDYVALGGAFELSLHETDAPAPPARTSLQVISAAAELRLRVPLSVRFALQLDGEVGVLTILGNALDSYGLPDAHDLGLAYGAGLGFDWHLLSPHHSLGLLLQGRGAPNLDDPTGDPTFAVGASVYLRYVF